MFKLFAGDLKSFGAAKYDAAGLLTSWIPFLLVSPISNESPLASVVPILFIFGLIPSMVMVGYTSVWSIRPMIAVLVAGLVALLLSDFGSALMASAVALFAFAVRTYNFRLTLAPHPFFQPDAFRPAFYDSEAGVAQEAGDQKEKDIHGI